MSGQYDNTNHGVLFKNDRKQPGTKQPDYRGKLDVDGVELEIAGWVRESKTGKKFLSLVVKAPDERRTQPRPEPDNHAEQDPAF